MEKMSKGEFFVYGIIIAIAIILTSIIEFLKGNFIVGSILILLDIWLILELVKANNKWDEKVGGGQMKREEENKESFGKPQMLVFIGILSFAVALFLAILGMRIPFLISATLGLILIFRAGWLTKGSMGVKNE